MDDVCRIGPDFGIVGAGSPLDEERRRRRIEVDLIRREHLALLQTLGVQHRARGDGPAGPTCAAALGSSDFKTTLRKRSQRLLNILCVIPSTFAVEKLADLIRSTPSRIPLLLHSNCALL